MLPQHPSAGGVVAAVIAAAAAAKQICAPHLPLPHKQTISTEPQHATAPAEAPSVPASSAVPVNAAPAPVITEHAARVALATRGAGGGLRAQAVEAGWVFSPYHRSPSAVISHSALWLVTHDGQTHDLTDEATDPTLLRYGQTSRLR